MQTTYRDLCSLLAGIYDNGEARAIVRLVLETKFDMSYTDILCDGLQQLSEADGKKLMDIMQQLAEGMPVQYVLGEAEFCGRMYKVNPGVLIPRPETAELAIAVSEEMKDKQQAAILDICTGSGCIATTIALECPKADVEAWDISPEALQVAKENAAKLGAKVNVVYQDALNIPYNGERWTAIVSNPPYVLDSERKDMSPHVLNHEPSLALFVPDTDPLRFYTARARYAITALVNGGLLYFEINPLCAKMVEEMLTAAGFKDVAIVDDQYGKQRFVKAYR